MKELRKESFLLKAGETEVIVFEKQYLGMQDLVSIYLCTPREMAYCQVEISLPKKRKFERVLFQNGELSWSFDNKIGGFGFSKSELEILNLNNFRILYSEDKRIVKVQIAYKNNIRKVKHKRKIIM